MVQGLYPTSHHNQWARAFIHEVRRLHAETHSHLWQLSWNWLCGGLTSVILLVLSTVPLQFQGWFVPTSLRPVLRIVAAYVMAIVWSSWSLTFSTWWGWGVHYLQNSSKDKAQNIIYSLGGGSEGRWLCLMTKLLPFGILKVFCFVLCAFGHAIHLVPF